MSGFSRLRIPVVTGSALSIVVGGLAPIAEAADKPRRASATSATVTEAGVKWFFDTSTNANTGSGGFCLSEASYAAAHPVTTLNGGNVSSTLTDGFDGGLCVAVNGVQYADPLNNITVLPVAGGSVVSAGAGTLSGLSVQSQYFVFSSMTAVRMLTSFTNPTAAPISVTVKVDTNFGSDSSTNYVQADLGGANPPGVLAGDRWTVSMQSYSGTTSSDPRIAMFRYSTGAASIPTVDAASGVNGTDDFRDVHSITVAPGATVNIMKFAYIGNSKAEAIAFAQNNFGTTTALSNAGLLIQLTQSQIANTVNIGQAAAAEPIAVPALGAGALAGLGLLVAAGAMVGRRRKESETGVQ